MRQIGLLFYLIALCFGPLYIQAQKSLCPAILLEDAQRVCSVTQPNHACYGAGDVDLDVQAGFPALPFDQPGHSIDVAAVRALTLTAPAAAQLAIRADLPDLPAEAAVRLWLFGDVQLQSVHQSPVLINATTVRGANVRAQPATDAPLVLGLREGDTLPVSGRLADGSWLRIQLPGRSGGTGWIFAELVQLDGDIGALPTLAAESAPDDNLDAPLQSFNFMSHAATTPCDQPAESGILLQTPLRSGPVHLSVNGALLELLDATAFLQTQADVSLRMLVLEGLVRLRTGNTFQRVPAGMQLEIPLDAAGRVAASPAAPQPYRAELAETLPFGLLERTIRPAVPLTQPVLNPQTDEWAIEFGLNQLTCPDGFIIAEDGPDFGPRLTLTLRDGGGSLALAPLDGETMLFVESESGVYTAAEGENETTLWIITPRRIAGQWVVTSPDGCTARAPFDLRLLGD